MEGGYWRPGSAGKGVKGAWVRAGAVTDSPAWELLSEQGTPCRRGEALGEQPNTTHLSPGVIKAVRTGIRGADVLTASVCRARCNRFSCSHTAVSSSKSFSAQRRRETRVQTPRQLLEGSRV